MNDKDAVPYIALMVQSLVLKRDELTSRRRSLNTVFGEETDVFGAAQRIMTGFAANICREKTCLARAIIRVLKYGRASTLI